MEKKDERSDLVTVDELIRWLRLGRTRVNEILRSGELPSFKLGRRRLVRVADVERWLDEHRYEPGA